MRRLCLTLCVAVGALIALAAGPAAPAGASVPTDCEGEAPTITGSGVINGTSGDDVILASFGPDVIRGNGGDDIICGGDGDDDIRGGSGNDLILGQGGNDLLRGDSGDDAIFGDGGITLLAEYDQADDLPLDIDCNIIRGGNDVLKGGGGNDALLDPCFANEAYGEQGRDAIGVTGLADGGSGNDSAGIGLPWIFLAGTFLEEPIVVAVETNPSGINNQDGHALGGSGRDDVNVAGGIADGGSGNDEVYGVFPGDTVNGGSANDELHNFTGQTPMTLNGGAGFDECTDVAGDTRISCEAVHV